MLLSTNTIENYNREISARQFLSRHSRWLKMRVVIHVWSFIADIFANPVFFAFLAMIASGFSTAISAYFVFVVLAKTSLDAFLLARFRPRMAFRHAIVAPAKDMLLAGIWFYSIFSRSVVWRGKRLRFGAESRLRPDEGNLGERLARRLLP